MCFATRNNVTWSQKFKGLPSTHERAHQCTIPFPLAGLPDENFNKKPNNAKKRPEKIQSDCLKARKKA